MRRVQALAFAPEELREAEDASLLCSHGYIHGLAIAEHRTGSERKTTVCVFQVLRLRRIWRQLHEAQEQEPVLCCCCKRNKDWRALSLGRPTTQVQNSSQWQEGEVVIDLWNFFQIRCFYMPGICRQPERRRRRRSS